MYFLLQVVQIVSETSVFAIGFQFAHLPLSVKNRVTYLADFTCNQCIADEDELQQHLPSTKINCD